MYIVVVPFQKINVKKFFTFPYEPKEIVANYNSIFKTILDFSDIYFKIEDIPFISSWDNHTYKQHHFNPSSF